jgi:hypothetical protein
MKKKNVHVAKRYLNAKPVVLANASAAKYNYQHQKLPL